MKKIFSILTVLLFIFALSANITKAAALTGVVYGPSGSTVGTYVPASSILGMFTTTTAVTAGSTILFNIPNNSVINVTDGVTVASDFTIQELGAGSAPTAPSTLAYSFDNHTLTFTVAAGSLSSDTAGVGSFVVKMSSTAGGNEIRNPQVATTTGAFAVTTSVGDGATTISDVTFTIAAASKLAFTGQPSTPTVASTAFATQPIVTIQDAYGNTRTADTSEITISAYTDAGCTTAVTAGTLSGTLSMNAVAGVADFLGLGLKYNKVGTIYLKAATGSLTSACSAAEVITVGAASKLIVSSYPTVGYTYSNFGTQPVVQITDADSNVVTTDNSQISIEAYTTTNFAGTKSEFNGTSTIYATDDGLVGGAATGIATFAGIKYNTVNTTGIFLCAWVDTNGDGTKDGGETITGCSPVFKIYPNSSSAPAPVTYTNTPTTTSAGTTTTTTSAGTTTTTTFVAATNVPTTIKPVAQMTVAEKTSYIQSLQLFLINLLTQLFNALKAAR